MRAPAHASLAVLLGLSLLSSASATAQPTLKVDSSLSSEEAVREVLHGPELTPVIVRDSLGSNRLARLDRAARFALTPVDLGPEARPWGMDILAWLRGEWAAPARDLELLALAKNMEQARYWFR